MKIGLIGLGKMGLNLALNLAEQNFEVIGFDVNEEITKEKHHQHIHTTNDLGAFMQALPDEKVIWLMVPPGDITLQTIDNITPYLQAGDMIIDGGNSNYKNTVATGEKLKESGIYFFDCGTSGGVSGARNGACLMIGGDRETFPKVEPIVKALALPNGYLYTGEVGSGHFLKMVHNGIEYGMMQAIAEGFEVLDKSPYDYDFKEVARVFNNGSVIESWLMELMENAFSEDEKLENIRGIMHSTGEGKWTVETALDFQVPTPVIALSLMMRYRSLEDDTFSGKVVAALRNQFGGHAVVKK